MSTHRFRQLQHALRLRRFRLRLCSLAGRGLWRELEAIRGSSKSVALDSTPAQLAKLVGVDSEEAAFAARELVVQGVVRGVVSKERIQIRWTNLATLPRRRRSPPRPAAAPPVTKDKRPPKPRRSAPDRSKRGGTGPSR